MKKIFFLFISFLTISSLLSMDQLENYIQKAENAEKSGKKDEALQWYGKAAAVIIPPKPEYGEDKYEKEREFQEKGARKIVIETKKLKAQKKYDEAIKVYKYAQDKFKTDIAQIEALQKPQQPESPEEEAKKDWIFITEMPGEKEQGTDYWRITEDPITKKHILELNKNEKDYVTHETFTEMMQKAQDNHIPFFLVMVEFFLATKTETGTINKKKIDLYEGQNAFHFLVESWNKAFSRDRLGQRIFIDPKTKAFITNITIFVMGDDSKFTKLKDKAEAEFYLDNFVEKIEGYYGIKPKDILSEKGKSQLLVADLFKNEAQKESNQKQKQELLQHARQWYEWALKYLPAGSPEYTQAQEQIKKIPKVEVLPEKPQEPKKDQKTLIQTLQNLTKKLQQIPATLNYKAF